jgi:hypothetical protein
VIINWTSLPSQPAYHLIQRASDGEHTQTSDPLVVTYINDVPKFMGTITGNTDVTCVDNHSLYQAGSIMDCDTGQTITREWAWNTLPDYPIDGWTLMTGSSFYMDYSSPSVPPGDIYLFQRAGDGVATSYDPTYLHVVYTNSPPETPAPPSGQTLIDCHSLIQDYAVGDAFDCDNMPLTREWALNDTDTPPAVGWYSIVGTSFQMNWTGADEGTWYLFQRVSDGQYTVTSLSLHVNVVNSHPTINSLTCDEGAGPFDSDGIAENLNGIGLLKTLHYTFDVNDCDGDPTTTYWIVTNSAAVPDPSNPSWVGPIVGSAFTVDLGDYTALAPAFLYVHLRTSDDGSNWVNSQWPGTINLWKRVYFDGFDSDPEMWTENGCVVGTGSYNWSYDGTDGYLRLNSYGASSQSAVWGDSVAFPLEPSDGAEGVLLSYMNPGLASGGLDYGNFSFLRDSGCVKYNLGVFNGVGCSTTNPGLKQYTIGPGAMMWGGTARVGVYENGLTGCGSSDYWIDWAGVWIRDTGD